MTCHLQQKTTHHLFIKKNVYPLRKKQEEYGRKPNPYKLICKPLTWPSLYQDNSIDLTFLVKVTSFFLYCFLVFYLSRNRSYNLIFFGSIKDLFKQSRVI